MDLRFILLVVARYRIHLVMIKGNIAVLHSKRQSFQLWVSTQWPESVVNRVEYVWEPGGHFRISLLALFPRTLGFVWGMGEGLRV